MPPHVFSSLPVFFTHMCKKISCLLDFGPEIGNLVEQITGMTHLALEIDAKSIPDAKIPTPMVQSTCKTAVPEQKKKT